jgi:hypothetical protein
MMKSMSIFTNAAAFVTMAGVALAPIPAIAQHDWNRDRDRHYYRQDDRRDRDRDHHSRDYDRRQQTKNEWRNIAIGAGGLGLLGLLNHDNTLMFAGTAGALYSLNRYEQDRRSQNDRDRLRAEYFSRPYFYRDGVRYDRETVHRHGNDYYRFHRH